MLSIRSIFAAQVETKSDNVRQLSDNVWWWLDPHHHYRHHHCHHPHHHHHNNDDNDNNISNNDNDHHHHHHPHHHLWVHAKVDDWIKEDVGLCDHCWNRHSIVRESGTGSKSCKFSFQANSNPRKWQMLSNDATNMKLKLKLTHCLQQWDTGIGKPNHEKARHHYCHLCKDKI